MRSGERSAAGFTTPPRRQRKGATPMIHKIFAAIALCLVLALAGAAPAIAEPAAAEARATFVVH